MPPPALPKLGLYINYPFFCVDKFAVTVKINIIATRPIGQFFIKGFMRLYSARINPKSEL